MKEPSTGLTTRHLTLLAARGRSADGSRLGLPLLLKSPAAEADGLKPLPRRTSLINCPYPMSTETDWSQWSRDAVAMMQRLNDAWVSRYRLAGARYHWDMNTAEITFHAADETVRASICVVGSTSAAEGTFLWSWANDSIPIGSKLRIHEVREFGQSNNLTLLRTGEWPGDTAAGLEMLAVASRILNAAGSWVEPAGDVTLFFALLHFRAGT